MKEEMFKAYDIRGLYGSEVTEEKFARLGKAFNSLASEIFFGRDYRLHNDELRKSFLEGFDGRVMDLGCVPTAAVSFHAKAFGAVLTGSHNPTGYNGLKVIHERHNAFSRELEQLEESFYNNGNYSAGRAARVEDASALLTEYLDALPAMEGGVFDLGGGAACAVEHIFPETIFSSPDPQFSCRAPLPEDKSLGELKKKTVEKQKVGFAFDGDADRMVVVDGGVVIDGGAIVCLIAQELLKQGDKIVVNIDFTQEAKDKLEEMGFQVVVCKVGTKHCVEALEKNNAAFAAERNGHYYIPRHLPDSDGFYPAALLSASKPGSILSFAQQFTNVMLVEAVRTQADFEKLAAACERKGGVVGALDGVHAVFEDFILLIRASNTEPIVRINSEAKDNELARKGMALAKELLTECVSK